MVSSITRARLCPTIVVLAMALAVAAGGEDRAEQLKRAEQLDALVKTLESTLLPEASEHNGMMANLEIRMTRLRWARENLPAMRIVEPWMTFCIAQDIVYPPTGERIDAVLRDLFDEQDEEFRALAETVRTQAATARDAFNERQKEVYTTLEQGDFVGPEYGDIERGIELVLLHIRTEEPQVNGKWKILCDYLADRLKDQVTAAAKDADDEIATGKAMRDAYWQATPVPPAVDAAFRRLEAIRAKMPRRRDTFFLALGPGATPGRFLATNAREMLDAMQDLDREVVQAVQVVQELDVPEEEKGSLLRGIDGCFDLRPGIRRQADMLRHGPQVYSLQLLIDVAGNFGAAAGWATGGRAHPPWWGPGDYERAWQCYNQLCAYRERWRRDPATGPLHALVETDEHGKPAWSRGGWLQWRWLDAEDMSDLQDEGRIMSLAGRRWVVPPGVSARGAATIEELLARGNVKELVVALDLNHSPVANGDQDR